MAKLQWSLGGVGAPVRRLFRWSKPASLLLSVFAAGARSPLTLFGSVGCYLCNRHWWEVGGAISPSRGHRLKWHCHGNFWRSHSRIPSRSVRAWAVRSWEWRNSECRGRMFGGHHLVLFIDEIWLACNFPPCNYESCTSLTVLIIIIIRSSIMELWETICSPWKISMIFAS